jgi:hypothetical protein
VFCGSFKKEKLSEPGFLGLGDLLDFVPSITCKCLPAPKIKKNYRISFLQSKKNPTKPPTKKSR